MTEALSQKYQCTAKSKRSGGQCRNAPIKGRKTCRMHNGRAARGFSNPSFKDGKYSKYLPFRIAKKYEEAESDQKLLSVRSDIALTEAFIVELIGKLQTGESEELWKSLRQAKNAYDRAASKRDIPAMHLALSQIGEAIERGAKEVELIEAIGKQIDRSRQLRETENKRLLNMQQVITAEQATSMLGAIVGILLTVLRKHLDENIAKVIYADISRGLDAQILGRP